MDPLPVVSAPMGTVPSPSAARVWAVRGAVAFGLGVAVLLGWSATASATASPASPVTDLTSATPASGVGTVVKTAGGVADLHPDGVAPVSVQTPPPAPSVGAPVPDVPDVTVPKVAPPSPAVPKVDAPKLGAPRIAAPDVAAPDVAAPAVPAVPAPIPPLEGLDPTTLPTPSVPAIAAPVDPIVGQVPALAAPQAAVIDRPSTVRSAAPTTVTRSPFLPYVRPVVISTTSTSQPPLATVRSTSGGPGEGGGRAAPPPGDPPPAAPPTSSCGTGSSIYQPGFGPARLAVTGGPGDLVAQRVLSGVFDRPAWLSSIARERPDVAPD